MIFSCCICLPRLPGGDLHELDLPAPAPGRWSSGAAFARPGPRAVIFSRCICPPKATGGDLQEPHLPAKGLIQTDRAANPPQSPAAPACAKTRPHRQACGSTSRPHADTTGARPRRAGRPPQDPERPGLGAPARPGRQSWRSRAIWRAASSLRVPGRSGACAVRARVGGPSTRLQTAGFDLFWSL